MKKPVFTGVCTALVTPFLEDKVNYPLVGSLIKRQIDAGINAIVLAGTTGEAPVLTDEEKIKLFQTGKKHASTNCKIIAGTGSNSTRHAIELSIEAEKAGADALLVVSPYYNKGTPNGLVQHFAEIANAVNIPVILYNVPARTSSDIPVWVYQELSKIPNIIGVKEASTDITKQSRIHAVCPSDFFVWTGNDDQIVPSVATGAIGVISVLSNILPVQTVAMTNAALAGDFNTAAALQWELMELIDLLFCEVNPVPVKYTMRHLGFDCGDCRLPLTHLTQENKRKIDCFFQ